MKDIVALRDRIAGGFMQPFFVPSLGVASRTLGDEIRRGVEEMKRGGECSVLASHPGDFELYRIGVFDEERGTILPVEQPEFVLQISALVEVKDV